MKCLHLVASLAFVAASACGAQPDGSSATGAADDALTGSAPSVVLRFESGCRSNAAALMAEFVVSEPFAYVGTGHTIRVENAGAGQTVTAFAVRENTDGDLTELGQSDVPAGRSFQKRAPTHLQFPADGDTFLYAQCDDGGFSKAVRVKAYDGSSGFPCGLSEQPSTCHSANNPE
jgi:hypothetical protein